MRLALDAAWVPSLLGVTRPDTNSNFTIKWPGRRTGSGSTFLLARNCATQHCSRYIKNNVVSHPTGWGCDARWKRNFYGNTNG